MRRFSSRLRPRSTPRTTSPLATVAEPDEGERVFYECCLVIAVTEPDAPCWHCGETAKATPMANLPQFHESQRVWYLRSQSAGPGYV